MGALTPAADCWLHDAIEPRTSSIEGLGLFATRRLPAGTVVERLGGRLVSEDELLALFAAQEREPGAPYIDTIAASDGLHLVLPPGTPLHYGNHSCEPNAWHVDAYTVATRRDIAPGEEITIDYGTVSAAAGWAMHCQCGAAACRGTITAEDWRIPELRQRYGEHWVPELLSRIDAEERTARALNKG